MKIYFLCSPNAFRNGRTATTNEGGTYRKRLHNQLYQQTQPLLSSLLIFFGLLMFEPNRKLQPNEPTDINRVKIRNEHIAYAERAELQQNHGLK